MMIPEIMLKAYLQMQMFIFFQDTKTTADPPCIVSHPKELKDVLLGEPVTFTIRATGTEPSYQWWWKPAGEESEEWQLCPTEWSHSTTLKIPRVQKSDEGSYRCVVSNRAGHQTSEAAKLCIGKNLHFSQLYETSQQCYFRYFRCALVPIFLPKL